jgi:hypothetical protein
MRKRVTPEDLQAIRGLLTEFKTELKAEFRAEFRQDLDQLRTELRQEIAAVEQRLTTKLDRRGGAHPESFRSPR